MNTEVKQLAEQLLHTGFDTLPERDRRVLARIAKRMHISRDLHAEFQDKLSFGDRLADRVAELGGSWGFIILFGVFLLAWVMLNSVIFAGRSVDPYPFIFLNLILSMLAAIQAPVIMMSQNRQSAKDRLAAAHDYEVNLKAELEIMALHEKFDQLRNRQLTEILAAQQEQIRLLTTLVEQRPVR
jgi:uncharacterized membrane protein